MGLFDVTCAISGTVITRKDPVVGFVLARKVGAPYDSFNGDWEFLSRAIRGTYDGCGWIRKVENRAVARGILSALVRNKVRQWNPFASKAWTLAHCANSAHRKELTVRFPDRKRVLVPKDVPTWRRVVRVLPKDMTYGVEPISFGRVKVRSIPDDMEERLAAIGVDARIISLDHGYSEIRARDYGAVMARRAMTHLQQPPAPRYEVQMALARRHVWNTLVAYGAGFIRADRLDRWDIYVDERRNGERNRAQLAELLGKPVHHFKVETPGGIFRFGEDWLDAITDHTVDRASDAELDEVRGSLSDFTAGRLGMLRWKIRIRPSGDAGQENDSGTFSLALRSWSNPPRGT